MDEPAINRPATDRRWPMTDAAWQALLDELGRLRVDVERLAGAQPADDGVIQLPIARAARRLEVLSAVADAAETVDAPDRAVIGRRLTLLEPDGESVTYALTFPGDGDPAQGWISADAPLGAALLDSRPGDQVEVQAPAGTRLVTVLEIA